MSVWKQLTGWQNSLLPSVLVQVRTATKRAAGSRTSMKDSAGRRLGPKKYEGQAIKPGEIIMRQRGTKFYPGENVGIGKDHTIFALEPGFVRYYLDPFHPKRKFIGVALQAETRLPTPHFDPRMRRFGREIIQTPEAAKKEESTLSRKDYLAKDSILQAQAERAQKREELRNQFVRQLKDELDIFLEGDALDFATLYLLRVRAGLRNGYTVTDAQFNARYYLEQELKLSDATEENLQLLSDVIERMNTSTSFDNKYRLTRFISPEEKAAWKSDFLEYLHSLNIMNKDERDQALEKFAEASKYVTLSEEVRLRRRFLKPVRPENEGVVNAEGKGTRTIKRYNYDKGRVDVVIRSKDAFLSKL